MRSKLKLTLEYFGSGFAGWAAQPGLRTVEKTLGEALATVLGAPVGLSVAGRTDAGVHAWGQVASFGHDGEVPDSLQRSLNGLLPDDVAVVGAELTADGFDARRDARSRTYCYRLLEREVQSPFERGRALWLRSAGDQRRLEQCAGLLPGTHDFTAFTPTETDHVRFERNIMRAEWRRNGDLLEFWIEADSFMRRMVRSLVGTMLEVSAERMAVDQFAGLLDGATRSAAGPSAAPHGLYLASVRYQ